MKKENFSWSPREFNSNNFVFSLRARIDNSIFSLVDLWVGNEKKEKIGEILKKKFTVIDRRSSSSYGKFQDKHYQYKDKYAKSKKALVKIQDGCDNFCTYCIVPYVRGRSKSRSVKEIIDEVKKLVKQGIEEIVFTGVDIGSYKFKNSKTPKSQNSKYKFQNSTLSQNKYGSGLPCTDLRPGTRAKFKNPLVQLIKVILLETEIKKISFGSMGLEVFDDEFIRLYQRSSLCLRIRESDLLRSNDQKFFSSVALSNKIGSDNKIKGEPLTTKKENFRHSPRKPDNDPSYSQKSINYQLLAINNRLSSHFHIPLQSGCDETLKRMNRKYSISNFEFLISKLKKKIPNFSFSTDIIVGFPGETKREFKKTITTIKTLKTILGKNFNKIHVFRYSPKKGTMAAKKKGQSEWEKVDEKEKKRRAKIISNFLN